MLIEDIVISSAKAHHFHTTTEFDFISPAYRYAQWLSVPSVTNITCQLVCFSGGHFTKPQKSKNNLYDILFVPWTRAVSAWHICLSPEDQGYTY